MSIKQPTQNVQLPNNCFFVFASPKSPQMIEFHPCEETLKSAQSYKAHAIAKQPSYTSQWDMTITIPHCYIKTLLI
jgi:hypothetical protein